MSSKGTPVHTFRLPRELAELVQQTIDRRNQWTIQEEWNLTDFLLTAVREKIQKMERSRRRHGAKATTEVANG